MYASFQHDRSAVAASTAMGWKNVCWGSDYPHLEGTYGHSQKTLHELLDDVEPAAARRIAVGAFQELFPPYPRRSRGVGGQPSPSHRAVSVITRLEEQERREGLAEWVCLTSGS